MSRNRSRTTSSPSRRETISRRLWGVVRLLTLALIGAIFLPAQGGPPTTEPAAASPPSASVPAPAGIPPEVVKAVKDLGTADDEGRKKIYELLAEKGDTRLIPVINAFKDGKLQNRDGRLVIYGDSVSRDGQNVFPLLDAFTLQPAVGPDGKPDVFVGKRIDLNASGMMRLPPAKRLERNVISDLVSALSLLDPDPVARRNSIREAGERASRVFPDPADEQQVKDAMAAYAMELPKPGKPTTQPYEERDARMLAAISAAMNEKPTGLFGPAPTDDAVSKVYRIVSEEMKITGEGGLLPPAGQPSPYPKIAKLIFLEEQVRKYRDRLEASKKNLDELPRYSAALKRQLASDPNGPFSPIYREAVAQMDTVLGDEAARSEGIKSLGEFATSRAENLLGKMAVAADRAGDKKLASQIAPSLDKARSYQSKVRFAQYTFAGLSAGSILVLMALGLAIIFGLMGVINMAHGEFMMVGAFTTLVIATWFKQHYPGHYDWFPIVAVPAAFLVAAFVGLATEYLVIRHLYGRTLDTLLATIGVGYVLVQIAKDLFGNNVSYNAPTWMQGGVEIMPDLIFAKNRLFIILYCALCITAVYLIVNKTKLGLLLRATTQNRPMAAALGVPTRWVDALTFAFGAGLAGLAGVVVPMVDKINPKMGQDYVVESFMVVVVGGVGKLAGAIIAGFGLGFTGKYLEPLLGSLQTFARTSSVFGKVIVLAAIVLFLQWRPSGLFPPKGRTADA